MTKNPSNNNVRCDPDTTPLSQRLTHRKTILITDYDKKLLNNFKVESDEMPNCALKHVLKLIHKASILFHKREFYEDFDQLDLE